MTSISNQSVKFVKYSVYLSFWSSVLILIAKIYGWYSTDSLSILSALIESVLDVFSAVINMVAIKYALAPADHEHRFGHGKIQDLALLSQSIFFLAFSFIMLYSGIYRIFHPTHIHRHELGIFIMIFTMVISAFVITYQIFVIRRTNSQLIVADKAHYISDFITNIGVICSICLAARWKYIEIIFILGMAFYIIYTACTLLKKAVSNLIDTELNQHQRQKILQVLMKYSEVKGVHDIKTRCSADKIFIQFHLELDGNTTLLASHGISSKISLELQSYFPASEIVIHQDPAGLQHDIQYQ